MMANNLRIKSCVTTRGSSTKRLSRLQVLEQRFSSPPSKLLNSPSTTLDSTAVVLSKSAHSVSNDPSYDRLCPDVLSGSAATYMQVSHKKDARFVVDSILRELVQTNEKSTKDIGGVLGKKIQDKFILLDSLSGQHGKTNGRVRDMARRNLGKRSKKHMSTRQHKRIGSFAFPQQFQKYSLFLPMNKMWKDYARRLIKGNSEKMIEPCLLQADLHGVILAVLQAKNTTFVGVQGIMVRETLNTFSIMTSLDKLQD
eukprot:c26196_g1_i2 orf=131-895(+)